MVKTIFKAIGVTLLLGYLLGAGYLYGFWRNEPRYRGMLITIDYPSDDAHFVTEASIRQLVEGKPGFRFKGKPYSEVNTLELAKYIEEKNRLVRHASCYHTPDSLLRIDIEQRNPIMRVKSSTLVNAGDGHSMADFYIDRDGAMMPAQFGTAIQLPLVTGFVKTRHIQPLHDFALFLKGDDFWSAEITQIYIRENGDAELIPRIGDHTILIGSFDDTQQKLDNVRTFYDKVLTRKGWNFYKTINVKFHGQVVGEK